MKKTEEQKQQILKEQWYKRNPCHDKDQNGVDRFWGTVLCVLEDYNKALTLTDVGVRKIVRCEDPMICLRGCSVHKQTCKHPIYER